MRSVFVLLALLAVALVVSLPSASAQAGCFACVVNSCAFYFNNTAPVLSIGAPAQAIAAAECATLNQDLFLFINTSQNASCAVTVAALACNVIAAVNVSEVNCNTSTIGVGTPFGNTSYFQQQCFGATKCLGYAFQSELAEFGACNSFQSFLGSVIAQATPSTLPCTQCPISSCYNATSYATNVSLWTGSLPGIAGNACASQQAAAANLLASGNPNVPYALVQQTVCVPLAILSLQDTQPMCAAGQVDPLFDGVLFSLASSVNQTWSTYCQQSIPQIFNQTAANRLLAAGYCQAPSVALTSYANTYLLPSAANVTVASSSSSTGVISASSSGSNGAAAAHADTLSSMATVAVLACFSLALFA